MDRNIADTDLKRERPAGGTYRFADIDVYIEHLFPDFAKMAAAYAVGTAGAAGSAETAARGAAPDCRRDGSSAAAGPAFSIATCPADVDDERRRSAEQDERDGIPVRAFSDGYLETLAIYRKLCDRLIERGVLLFHSSAVEADGKAYLFTAPSGTGKSTHARLWKEVYGARVRIINDDKPLLRFGDKGAAVYGTPWDGKHRLSENVSAPLGGICVLERGEQNAIKRLAPAEALPHLLRQIYRPENAEGAARMTELAIRLAAETPCFALTCNMDAEAARVAFEALTGGRQAYGKAAAPAAGEPDNQR